MTLTAVRQSGHRSAVRLSADQWQEHQAWLYPQVYAARFGISQRHPHFATLHPQQHQLFHYSGSPPYPSDGIYTDPGSPQTIATAASFPLSDDCGTSSDPGTTDFLHQQTQLSPPVHTPTSSEASHLAGETDRFAQHGARWQQASYNHGPQSLSEFSGWCSTLTNEVLSPPDQPLQGLEPALSDDRRLPTLHSDLLEAPLGRPPALLRPSPVYTAPWSQYPLRSETSGPGCEGGSPASSGQDERPSPRRPRRSGPLSVNQRERTKGTRKRGACLRCRLYRETCDEGTPCGRCQKGMRKWKLGCVKIFLEKRLSYLQPDVLAAHLSWDSFSKYISENSYRFNYAACHSHDLLLTWGLGPFLRLPVKQVETFGPRLYERDALQYHQQTRDHADVECIEMRSPPLLPDLLNKKHAENVRDQIAAWLGFVVKYGSDHFVWHCFYEDSEMWQRETLRKIWAYHQPAMKEHDILASALKLVILNHALTHALVVPKEHISKLYRDMDLRGQMPSEDDYISPKLADRFCKMLMYPPYKQLAQECLSGLQALLLEKKEDSMHKRDMAFCVSFLLLIVLGRNQNAVIDLATVRQKREEPGLTMDGAKHLAGEMETEITDHIIGLYQWKTEGSQKKTPTQHQLQPFEISAAEDHARTASLFAHLDHIHAVADEGGLLPSTTLLPSDSRDIDESSFSGTNLVRVLLRFYQAHVRAHAAAVSHSPTGNAMDL